MGQLGRADETVEKQFHLLMNRVVHMAAPCRNKVRLDEPHGPSQTGPQQLHVDVQLVNVLHMRFSRSSEVVVRQSRLFARRCTSRLSLHRHTAAYPFVALYACSNSTRI